MTGIKTYLFVHPLSYRRGMLPKIMQYLLSKGVQITSVIETRICQTKASALHWSYGTQGTWDRPMDTVVLDIVTPIPPDEVIGTQTPQMCSKDTLRGRLYDPNSPSCDVIVTAMPLYKPEDKDPSQMREIVKEMFELYPVLY